MCPPYHYSLHCLHTRFRSRVSLCVHTISLQPSLVPHTLKKLREPECQPYHYSLNCSRTSFRSRGSLCVHHTITAFIVCTHALEIEGTCVPTSYHYRLHCSPKRFRSRVSLCVHIISLHLHCSRTRFRCRGNLCAHIISLETSLLAHTLKKMREPVCPHHIITDFIVQSYALEAEGTCVHISYHYSFIVHAHA